jgi:hypothetical protein
MCIRLPFSEATSTKALTLDNKDNKKQEIPEYHGWVSDLVLSPPNMRKLLHQCSMLQLHVLYSPLSIVYRFPCSLLGKLSQDFGFCNSWLWANADKITLFSIHFLQRLNKGRSKNKARVYSTSLNPISGFILISTFSSQVKSGESRFRITYCALGMFISSQFFMSNRNLV